MLRKGIFESRINESYANSRSMRYIMIKGSLVANFRYTNFWVAGEE